MGLISDVALNPANSCPYVHVGGSPCVHLNHVHNRGFWVDGLLREFIKSSHHTPGPGGIASLDPQTVLQYLTLCVTTIMRP